MLSRKCQSVPFKGKNAFLKTQISLNAQINQAVSSRVEDQALTNNNLYIYK